jgi:hypothetical protein
MFAAMEREQHLDEILGDYLAASDASLLRRGLKRLRELMPDSPGE